MLSDKGKGILEMLEANKLFPYDDRNGKRVYSWSKYATIGIGYLIPANEWDIYAGGITKEQSYKLLDITLDKYEEAVQEQINIKLTTNQYDALVILCYNIGIAGFKSSQVVKMINGRPGNYPTLNQAWMSWNKDNGAVSNGLINRRKAEWRLYNS